MLFKISLNNIKRSMKDYAIYFFTLILGVAIFYVFNAIDSQTVMLDVTSSTYDIIKLMTNMLSGISVFISFVLGFLIIYASRFLIKRRNKEFGIYLTLGMGKRKVSLILFFETLFIGIISLIVGLGLGILLSQAMSILVSSLFEADMTKFTFTISNSACLKTLIYFSIIYLFVMLFNTIVISKCRLIDLITASKKSEKIKLKNPFLCIIIFLSSCLTLGYAYYLVTAGVSHLTSFNSIFIPIALGSISTYFIFWSLSGLILKIFQSFKSFYYKGLNSFVIREFSSKINTIVVSMTIICIMLFVTICVLSSSLSIKNSMMKNLEELAPTDIMLIKKMNETSSNNELAINSKLTILETLNKLNINIQSNLENYVTINTYRFPNLTMASTLGTSLKEIQNTYKFMTFNTPEEVIKVSDYNKIAKLYHNPEYTLNDNEYLIIADFDSMVEVRNIALKDNVTITINGKELTPKYNECQEGFVEMSSNHINSGIIIVPDNLMSDNYLYSNILIGNYNVTKKEDRLELENKLTSLIQSNLNRDIYPQINASSKLAIAEASTGLGALVTFIGLYLGIIFLISSAAILALKSLSESSDNKVHYNILRKLGTDEKLLNKALFKDIAIFFASPLLLAIIHSIFGIKFCTYILEVFGNKGLLPSIIMTAIFIVIIYGGYFLITYFSSKNIIKSR